MICTTSNYALIISCFATYAMVDVAAIYGMVDVTESMDLDTIVPESIEELVQEDNFDVEIARRYLNYSFAAYCNPASLHSNAACPWGEACTLEMKHVEVKDKLLAYVAWHPTHNEIILAFRGTILAPSNLLTDLDETIVPLFNNSGWGAHRGFHNGYNTLKDVLHTQVAGERKAHPDAPLIITGHSLGGALATMAAADFALNLKAPNTQCYTFGSPRVFTESAAKATSEAVPFHRVVGGHDPVPHVPPCGKCQEGGGIAHAIVSTINSLFTDEKKQGYWHVAKEVWNPHSCNYPECSDASIYKICDVSGEDKTCSNSLAATALDLGEHMDGYLGVHANKLIDDKVACPVTNQHT